MENEALVTWPDLGFPDRTRISWPLHVHSQGSLSCLSKARKGNVGTSVEWRLNSENDSRLHGQPSVAAFSVSIAWPPPTTRNNRSTVDDECWVVGGGPLHNLSFFNRQIVTPPRFKDEWFWGDLLIGLQTHSSWWSSLDIGFLEIKNLLSFASHKSRVNRWRATTVCSCLLVRLIAVPGH